MTVGGPVAPGSEDPLLGRVLSERYRILRKLGEGGMGVVYLAEHVVIEKKIALKVLFPDLTRRADLVQRFMQEAKSASRIGHENVIDITDFGQSPEGYVFIAMEYLSGQDLGQVLKASGAMPWHRTQPIVLQIVKALRAAHERGIIHRDMKPENVFVLPRDDGREFVKVLDFGIAKVLGLDEDAPRLTRTGMIFGTPEYMSPEQAQGQQVDHRVDIYAVGCIMYHMLTGDVPFRAESFMGILSKHMLEQPIPAATRNPAIEARVEAVVMRAMEKNPADRFQSMGEFVDALVPLGYVRDLSGAISLSTGLPTAAAGASPPVLSQAAVQAPAPAVAHAHAPAAAPATPEAAAQLLHATKQIAGRANTPLAQPNLEARRSETAIFSHDADEAPRVPRSSGNMVVIGVGVGTVLLLAILYLVFRGPSRATGDAPAAGSVTAPVAPGSPSQAVPSVAGPGAAATGEAAASGSGAEPARAPTRPTGAAATSSPPAAGGVRKLRDSGSASRPHRTSREAINSLFPTGAGEDPAEKSGAKPGARTPDELKNPFAAPTH